MIASAYTNKELTTQFAVRCDVNGLHFELKGTGQGFAPTGLVSVEANLTSGMLPKDFNLALFAFTLLVGQPDISQKAPGALNPFQLVAGGYSCVRQLDLGENGYLVGRHAVTPLEGTNRTAQFEISGEVCVPELIGVEPTSEIWMPGENGLICGVFPLIWRTADDSFMMGTVHSEYNLGIGSKLAGVMRRDISFDVQVGPNGLRQSEVIRLVEPSAYPVSGTSLPVVIGQPKLALAS